MPRYGFQWANLPLYLLDALTADAEVSDSPATEVLRSWYGARPDKEFVRENWDTLRERWLSRDSEARKAVVEKLWNLPVGEGVDYPRTKTAEVDFLGSCRNARRLRGPKPRRMRQGGNASLAS